MTNDSASVRVGFQALRVNPLRTLLSTLGVIMGVGSMVSVLAMGDGVEKYARDQVARTSDVQSVTVTASTGERLDGVFIPRTDVVSLGLAEAGALRAAVPEVASVQLAQAGATIAQRDSASPKRGLSVLAMLPSAFATRKLGVRIGRTFSDDDVRSARHVAVLSASAADTLAGAGAGASLAGRSILLNGRPFDVAGVLAKDTMALERPQLFVPFGAGDSVFVALGRAPAPQMTLTARDVESVAAMKRRVEGWFARRYGAAWSRRVSITANSVRVEQLTQALRVFKLLMGAITSVSLLVGGIGIMNVLLASVAERTREIGIRKAAGARNRDILLQFLSESVAITGAGAALGVLLGLAIAFLAAAIMRAQTEAPVHAAITIGTIGVAALASIAVGLTFGLYPALRASRLSPIEAIRHE
jgi:putative ABC transport system permease protein